MSEAGSSSDGSSLSSSLSSSVVGEEVGGDDGFVVGECGECAESSRVCDVLRVSVEALLLIMRRSQRYDARGLSMASSRVIFVSCAQWLGDVGVGESSSSSEGATRCLSAESVSEGRRRRSRRRSSTLCWRISRYMRKSLLQKAWP